jgi:hypothetical protein
MHSVAKPARSKVKKGTVDEAVRKLALRAAKINKVQPSYTFNPAGKNQRNRRPSKTTGVWGVFPRRTPDMPARLELIHQDIHKTNADIKNVTPAETFLR